MASRLWTPVKGIAYVAVLSGAYTVPSNVGVRVVSHRQPLASGEIVHARYTVERLLGRGAFGATYLVSDRERFGASCALKELQPQGGALHGKARELFEREARMLLTIKHPQVPALHAYFEKDGRYFLVQALVEGEALDTVLEETGEMPEESVRRIVLEVLNVLDYLHRRSPPVVHRDIKPSNLIRDKDGRINVIDFGAVREAISIADNPSGVTMIGTPGFAPLEQAIGQPVPASDIHALGMTALCMLTKKYPSEWRDHVTGELSMIGRTGASPEFERILARMIADLPDRYQSAAAVTADLLGGATKLTEARAKATVVTGEPTAVEPAVPAKKRVPEKPAVSRTMQRYVVGGIAVVVIGGFGVYMALNKDGTGENPGGAASPPATTPASAASSPAPVLNDESTLRRNGIALSVRHPSTWQLLSTKDDDHIALKDPVSTGIFLTGFEASREPALQFARQVVVRVSSKYGQVDLADDGQFDQATSAWRFHLTVKRSTVAEEGLLVIEAPPPQNGTTPYRWWALVGQAATNTQTAVEMANSLVAKPTDP